MSAAVDIIGERADVSGQGYGQHPEDCPASAFIGVINCECGGRALSTEPSYVRRGAVTLDPTKMAIATGPTRPLGTVKIRPSLPGPSRGMTPKRPQIRPRRGGRVSPTLRQKAQLSERPRPLTAAR